MTTAPAPWDATPAVRLTRRYDATPEALFRAFTDPALLRQWWKPDGFVVDRLDFPARAGADYRIRLRAPDGTVFEHVGTILEVVPPRSLVYTWRWTEGPLERDETLVELSSAPDGTGSRVTVCHSRFATEAEADRHVGWRQALDALAGLFVRA